MVVADDVVMTCQRLSAYGIAVWLTGGWGIDALLREQTRPHNDLDLLVHADDVVRLRTLLARDAYHLKELRSDNVSVIHPQEGEIPTAFVWQDGTGRDLDVHAFRQDEKGKGIPAWTNDEGLVLTKADLAGDGMIAACAAHCTSPGAQLQCHSGYDLPAVQQLDLKLLCERFGLVNPADYHHRRAPDPC